MTTVLLTDPIHADAHGELARAAQVRVLPPDLQAAEAAATLRSMLADSDALLVRRRLPADVFDAAPRLRAVVRHGAGVDILPVDRATALGIPVANVPGGNANAVAEFAIAAMMELARGIGETDRQMRTGVWRQRGSAGLAAFELGGRTLGVVGLGAIGARVATIAKHGFGMQVLALRRASAPPAHVQAVDFDHLLAASDVVVLACPLTPETRGLFDASAFARMRSGALLVNVARGAVVREDDLADALRSGHLGGAALDVFETEPLPQDSPLRGVPRVLLTPHLAGQTVESERGLGLAAVRTLLAVLRGEPHPDIVNPDYALMRRLRRL